MISKRWIAPILLGIAITQTAASCDNGISDSKGTVTFVHSSCATDTYGQAFDCPGQAFAPTEADAPEQSTGGAAR